VIVVDSSFLIAYHTTRDVHHPAAVRAMRQLCDGECGTGLLLEDVFLEVVRVLLLEHGFHAASDRGFGAVKGITVWPE
jgi:predicted nucleic acid-binding protein